LLQPGCRSGNGSRQFLCPLGGEIGCFQVMTVMPFAMRTNLIIGSDTKASSVMRLPKLRPASLTTANVLARQSITGKILSRFNR
jgi:hypothetical protein